MKLPDNFAKLPREEQRRIIQQRNAERLEQGDPDAWMDILLYAVSNDPHIPEGTKTKLRAKLIQTQNGSGSIDPISSERRAAEHNDMMVYAALIEIGGGIVSATKELATRRPESAATLRRAYERHVGRWPQCERLDGRRKRKRPQTWFLRG